MHPIDDVTGPDPLDEESAWCRECGEARCLPGLSVCRACMEDIRLERNDE